MVFDPATGLPVADPPAPIPTNQPGNLTINMPAPPAPVAPAITPEIQAYIDSERERVRTEEKNKLYPQLEDLKTQVGIFAQEREQRLAADEEAQRQAAEAERVRQESEMTQLQLFDQRQAEAEQRFNQLQADLAQERALREREAEFSQILEYKTRRITEESENIAPQFADLVSGSTKEQIEESINRMKTKTAEILAEVQNAGLAQRRQSAMPVTGGPPIDMVGRTGGGSPTEVSFTPEQLRAMPLEEYAAIRSQLLNAASSKARTDGMYAP